MLYVVGTPIGNLEDVTLRALRILKEADVILCEDTRVTRKILDRYEISNKKLESYHHHTSDKKVEKLVKLISENNVALVTDAGTPGISDPGNKLINEALKHLSTETQIIPIPGPSALTTALSISGFPTDNFLFKGFVPHKKGRETFLNLVVENKETVVFYESCHRIIKTLDKLQEIDNTKQLVVCRELTKKFESIYRGTAEEILNSIKKDFPSGKPKGEFVVVTNQT